jgi:CubicO group peptidase (beta-lactamase class C family)
MTTMFTRASVALLLALAMLPLRALAADDDLIGLWASETSFGPALRGDLTLVRNGADWRATIAGDEAKFSTSSDDIRFAFAGNRGAYRGTLAHDRRSIEGFWLQPSGATQDRQDPGGAGQPFATPLVLRQVKPNTWRAEVRPLDDRFTLYLKIFRDDKGALLAAFRNPELNSRGGLSQFRATRTGDALHFERTNPDAPVIVHDASVLHAPDRIRIAWPDVGRTLELSRIAPADATGFFARPPAESKYAYREPAKIKDGWSTQRARDAGIDEAALVRLVQRLIDDDPSARRPSLIHSMLVAYRGKLVLEEYFHGYDRDTPHDIRSAGKTFGSVLVGAARMDGTAIAPETRVYDLLAGMGPFANPDPRKAQITLAHLMAHSSGLACDDNDEHSPGNESTMQSQPAQPDWWKYTLDLPMAHDAGTRYAYCSANSNLVGAALTRATGVWLPALFERDVARPLGFGRYHWNLMPNGEGYLGGGAFVRPRDLLKIGQTWLNGGTWHGRRIVDAAWVKRSTAREIEISPATTGLSDEAFSQSYIKGADGSSWDGLAWHLVGIRAPTRTYSDYEATGNGGQLLIVVPELDLVVVFTAGNYMQGGIWNQWRHDIVGAGVIPALRR